MRAGPHPPGPPAVVVAGDALVDLTPVRTVTGDIAYQPRPGGSCLNVAAGPGRLGVPAVEVVDTVGAGDAFAAGMPAHLHRVGRLGREGVAAPGAEELAGLLAYAVEVVADTCTRAGAQPPFHRDGVPMPPGQP